ncbi:FHA domain-containing protein [Pulveribacter suum]|uniref:FHA domain-containing protein n=1 Tax=Pulveribacter suum TaxID=2116657 RepID=A0A2P1NI88_9BURK|nr:FHA domain-containing protein [Pulveribacter suum]AVP56741.1 FHA domain-containing protein [Pulveribacter suum]
MSRMVVTIDGVVIKEVPLTKERTSIGRRPYNDIVIDHLAVSGEHAVILLSADGSADVEDMGSTNGTFINSQAIKRHTLRNGDMVEVGKYKLRYMADEAAPDYEKTVFLKPGMLPPALPPRAAPAPAPAAAPLNASVRVISGPAAGREVALTKVVTTIGKPGVAVASITKRHHGFVLAHVEGGDMPLLNGVGVSSEPVPLKTGDRIALAGTEMEFVLG